MGLQQLIKPTAEILANPESALRMILRLHDVVAALAKAADGATPENVAARFGKVGVVQITGATVTDPLTGETFTADVFVEAVLP